jgi:hypothetical protein
MLFFLYLHILELVCFYVPHAISKCIKVYDKSKSIVLTHSGCCKIFCFVSCRDKGGHTINAHLSRICMVLIIYSSLTAIIFLLCAATTIKNNEVDYQIVHITHIQHYISIAVQHMASHTLSAIDYVLFILLLLSSAVIGAIFGFFKSKRSSAKEFLLGMINVFSSCSVYNCFSFVYS